jgi:hypothetical protein
MRLVEDRLTGRGLIGLARSLIPDGLLMPCELT